MLQKHDPVRVSVASGPPTCEFALCFGRVIILSPLLIPGPLPVAAQNAGGKAGTARVTEAASVTEAGTSLGRERGGRQKTGGPPPAQGPARRAQGRGGAGICGGPKAALLQTWNQSC